MARADAAYLGWADSPASNEVEQILGASFTLVFTDHFSFGDRFDENAVAPLGVDYLFSFGPTIVRTPLLSRVRRAAINFHTGPPRWPGRGSVSFALLDDDRDFGVTAHLMTETVDAGPILKVIRFPIEMTDTVEALDARAKEAIPRLVEAVVSDLEHGGGAAVPSGERWERPAMTRRDLIAAMRIDDADGPDVVQRKIRAFAHPTRPGPYVERGGVRFWYAADATE